MTQAATVKDMRQQLHDEIQKQTHYILYGELTEIEREAIETEKENVRKNSSIFCL